MSNFWASSEISLQRVWQVLIGNQRFGDFYFARCGHRFSMTVDTSVARNWFSEEEKGRWKSWIYWSLLSLRNGPGERERCGWRWLFSTQSWRLGRGETLSYYLLCILVIKGTPNPSNQMAFKPPFPNRRIYPSICPFEPARWLTPDSMWITLDHGIPPIANHVPHTLSQIFTDTQLPPPSPMLPLPRINPVILPPSLPYIPKSFSIGVPFLNVRPLKCVHMPVCVQVLRGALKAI